MDIVYKGFIKRMEKANNDMMMDENSRSWYVLYTAPRLERKLMQHLTVAGYKTYCPMQTIYVNWNGKTKEIIVPFFSRFSKIATFSHIYRIICKNSIQDHFL